MPPVAGGPGINLRSLLSDVASFAKSKVQKFSTAPCDGFILKLHYRWTFLIFLGGFFSVWYSWYHREVITCVSHFNAETQVRLDYINICLSYPFVKQPDGSRRYLLFYRWIHWTFLLLAFIYYIPRKLSKAWDHPKFTNLVEKLAENAHRLDSIERDLLHLTARYVVFNFHTNNGLYYKYVITNAVALVVDVFALNFLDFVLQNRFVGYGYKAFPYSRDPQTFSDYMSKTFPPFASCELEETNQLTARRDEALGCHLTFMELYEKIFLFLWYWIILLIFITIIYLIFILCMFLPKFHPIVLRTAKPAGTGNRSTVVINAVCMQCKVGDIYLLYRLKQHFTHVRFYELLRMLGSPRAFENVPFTNGLRQHDNEKPDDDLRKRKPSSGEKSKLLNNNETDSDPQGNNSVSVIID